MKRISLLLLLAALLLPVLSNAQQDEHIVWSKFQYPIQEIFTVPDTNFIYANQWDLWRFVKIDANTGDIIDSVWNKGMICGISNDSQYIYTRLGHLGSIKKLDINTYQVVDSIDNMQDCNEGNPVYDKDKARVMGMKLTNNGKLIVYLMDGKYAFIILNANDLEIIAKKPTSEISDSLIAIMNVAISPKNDYFILDHYYYVFSPYPNEIKSWDEVHVWDLQTLKPIGKTLFNGRASRFYIFTFSPDGEYVFIRDAKLRIFDTKNFELMKSLDVGFALDFSSNNKYFAASYYNGPTYYDPHIGIYSMNNFEQVCNQKENTEKGTIVLKFSSDDKYLYTCDALNAKFTKYKTCLQTTSIPNETNKIDLITNNNNELRISNENLKLFKIINYQISDIKGNIVQEGEIERDNSTTRIGISNLTSGVYFLRIGNDVYKFVKM